MTESRRSRLYTRTGDDGTTGLFGAGRVGKEHPRIEAYGDVDELNACIGWARAAITGGAGPALLDRILEALQARLFELGADLATPPGSTFEARVRRIGEEDVTEAERWIDEVDAGNEPLRSFVLPGGSESASRLHVARTVARRAERAMVALARSEPVGEPALRFINRVSDLLFAMARRANRGLGVPDVPWVPRQDRRD